MARILIVEDDVMMARLMRDVLAVDGHEIETTEDGNAALRMIQAAPYELVLLDVNLPGHDGIEICRRVRETERPGQRATIVMITGRHETSSKLLAFSVGADDYLVKPIDVRELHSRVLRWVASRSEQADLVVQRRRDAIAEIVAAICHELNNPLAAATIGVELVLRRGGLTADSQHDLETVRESLYGMDDVLKKLTGVKDRTVSYVGDAKMIDIRGEQ